MPPGPTSVTSRQSGFAISSANSASSVFPAHEGSRCGRQVVRWGWGAQDLSGQNLFVKRHRFVRWLDAQFLGQCPAAGFVLGQRRAALTVERQQAHQLAVRFFAPRLELHLLPGIVARSIHIRRAARR